MENYLIPIVLVLYIAFEVFRSRRFKKIKAVIPGLLTEGAVVVDVRSAAEFKSGARPGSINIPLAELSSRIKEIDTTKTVILCCASGSRSGVAESMLKKQGVKSVVNAGPWKNTI